MTSPRVPGPKAIRTKALTVAAVCAVVAAAALVGGDGFGQGRSNVADYITRSDAPVVLALERAPAVAGRVSGLEVTIRPVVVSPDNSVALRIDLVDAAQFQSLGTGAPKVATGTVSFYPPAKVGKDVTFVVPIDAAGAASVADRAVAAVVSAVPTVAGREVGAASFEVVSARLR